MKKKPRILIDCLCGCGCQLENLDKKARPKHYIAGHNSKRNPYWLGKKFNQTHRQKIRDARKIQEKTTGSPNWKGGQSQMTNGYIRIWAPNHPQTKHGYVFEHRLVMEKKLGRYLTMSETIHHKNGDKADNRLENLVLFNSHSDHMKGAHAKHKSI